MLVIFVKNIGFSRTDKNLDFLEIKIITLLFLYLLYFADLKDLMLVSVLIFMWVKHVLENCKEDMDFFNKCSEKGIIDR
ncbi:putative asparagine--tRNA ligase [Helianthus annuus]|nr:putative asparagine--tRNA ligase [Helianthus annuus]KAJ0788151.1 putative asparagine--tRNA ligase [Helianthus annuus]